MRAFILLALLLQPSPALTDQYPDDPFAFGCHYDTLIGPGSMTAQGCAVALATCIDAGIESCASDPKGCHEHQDSCIGWVETSCWSQVD